MASIPWPEDLCSGAATWWLGYMAADSYIDDDRYPQLKAGAGIRVNFSPDVNQAVRYNGVDGNKTIMPLVSTGIIDDEGYLCTENEDGSAGERGVVLPSSECDSLTPRDWTWTVTVTENRIRINRFSISLSPGETIDLADYAPVDSSGGTHIVTETETAERAEKAATQAGQYRQETKTDREATQRLRNEAESFRNEAGSSATSSAQSATSAAEILSDVQDLGITVDTSVGTRVFIGDTMIYGDTGWRNYGASEIEAQDIRRPFASVLKRENSTVSWHLYINTTSDNVLIPGFFPNGFRPAFRFGKSGPGSSVNPNWSVRAGAAAPQTGDIRLTFVGSGGLQEFILTFPTRDAWPSINPGTPR